MVILGKYGNDKDAAAKLADDKASFVPGQCDEVTVQKDGCRCHSAMHLGMSQQYFSQGVAHMNMAGHFSLPCLSSSQYWHHLTYKKRFASSGTIWVNRSVIPPGTIVFQQKICMGVCMCVIRT